MNRILIVGAGQLGSRYLQGLAAVDDPLSILVVDSSPSSLDAARARMAEVSSGAVHDVQFSTYLETSIQQFDLAIVVTPAHCRSRVTAELASSYQVKAWILEKVLAQSVEQLALIEKACSGQCHAWVNTPRRLMSWHQEIRSQLLPQGPVPLSVRVSGGSWGLASNSIHFIDLVSWWTQSSVQSLDAVGLSHWAQSKRAGFHEVFGNLTIAYVDGSELEICCGSGSDPLRIFVVTPQGEWVIEEAAGVVKGPAGQKLHGQLIHQSALTAPLAKQILLEQRCNLPTLAESAAQHQPFLTALLKHWNQSQGSQDQSVPIT